ncbi:PEP-CTERM sorting domain-containing protein [Mucisphaera sp.]|uniref:PEP-CTERM sorting domain-containing protein n=1 Tax=Mucisphaera sp. TaxID=2913024 RepID=UPI003D0AFC0C
MIRTTASLIALGLAAPAFAAPVIDGTVDAMYGAPLAVQTVETQFGDNFSELNAAYATVANDRLYVTLTGNIETNFNKISIFIDSKAGGENTLDGSLAYDFGDVASNFGGLTFDAGFEADYHMFARTGGGNFEVDIVDRANSAPGAELGNFGSSAGNAGQLGTIAAIGGTATTGADAGTFLTQDVLFAMDNSNVAGVLGGTAAADPVAAAAVTTGLEFSIALADLGTFTAGDVIKIHAAVGNGDNNFHSNQILGGLPAPQGNLGGDGGGGFTGNLAGIDFNQYAGDQFFTVVVPEPASAALLGLAGLALTRRR